MKIYKYVSKEKNHRNLTDKLNTRTISVDLCHGGRRDVSVRMIRRIVRRDESKSERQEWEEERQVRERIV